MWESSAMQGNSVAMMELGKYYSEIKLMPTDQDYKKAIKYFYKCLKYIKREYRSNFPNSDPSCVAYFSLGTMCYHGTGVKLNYTKAKEFWEKALQERNCRM